MLDFRIGYEYYKEACDKHELEPVNFHYFVINLSIEQLNAYNDRAAQKSSVYEYVNS